MHELLARDVERQGGALVNHPLRRDDVQHRSGQRFVESSGLQLGSVCVRLSPSRRQFLGRRAREGPYIAFLIDAEERLHDWRAIKAEEYLLGQLITHHAIGVQRGRDLRRELRLQREERVVGRRRPAGLFHGGSQPLHALHPRIAIGEHRVAEPERV